VHDEAARVEDTDWPQILALYGLLRRLSDNPMVALGAAIAAAMVHGPAVGLEQVAALDADARIRGHYRLDAVRAHLHELAGDRERALAHYRAAAERTTSLPERDYLIARAARLDATSRDPHAPGVRQPHRSTSRTRSQRMPDPEPDPTRPPRGAPIAVEEGGAGT
jgi:predicted RNA polymerase sigma factor